MTRLSRTRLLRLFCQAPPPPPPPRCLRGTLVCARTTLHYLRYLLRRGTWVLVVVTAATDVPLGLAKPADGPCSGGGRIGVGTVAGVPVGGNRTVLWRQYVAFVQLVVRFAPPRGALPIAPRTCVLAGDSNRQATFLPTTARRGQNLPTIYVVLTGCYDVRCRRAAPTARRTTWTLPRGHAGNALPAHCPVATVTDPAHCNNSPSLSHRPPPPPTHTHARRRLPGDARLFCQRPPTPPPPPSRPWSLS